MDDNQAGPANPASLVDRVDGLAALVRTLKRRVDELAGHRRSHSDADPPALTRNSPSPTGGEAELEKLAVWVDWLQERYGTVGDWLRPCWWRHGMVVEELWALRTAWLGVYGSDEKAASAAALTWHESAERCRERIRRAIATGPGCTAVRHKPDESVTADPRWVEEMAALRGEPPDQPGRPDTPPVEENSSPDGEGDHPECESALLDHLNPAR